MTFLYSSELCKGEVRDKLTALVNSVDRKEKKTQAERKKDTSSEMNIYIVTFHIMENNLDIFTFEYKHIKCLKINEKQIRTENCVSMLADSYHLLFIVSKE